MFNHGSAAGHTTTPMSGFNDTMVQNFSSTQNMTTSMAPSLGQTNSGFLPSHQTNFGMTTGGAVSSTAGSQPTFGLNNNSLFASTSGGQTGNYNMTAPMGAGLGMGTGQAQSSVDMVQPLNTNAGGASAPDPRATTVGFGTPRLGTGLSTGLNPLGGLGSQLGNSLGNSGAGLGIGTPRTGNFNPPGTQSPRGVGGMRIDGYNPKSVSGNSTPSMPRSTLFQPPQGLNATSMLGGILKSPNSETPNSARNSKKVQLAPHEKGTSVDGGPGFKSEAWRMRNHRGHFSSGRSFETLSKSKAKIPVCIRSSLTLQLGLNFEAFFMLLYLLWTVLAILYKTQALPSGPDASVHRGVEETCVLLLYLLIQPCRLRCGSWGNRCENGLALAGFLFLSFMTLFIHGYFLTVQLYVLKCDFVFNIIGLGLQILGALFAFYVAGMTLQIQTRHFAIVFANLMLCVFSVLFNLLYKWKQFESEGACPNDSNRACTLITLNH